jgi:DNA-binding XRE family transcriptional regulator
MMAHNFDKLKKGMKPENLRKAQAKAKEMMAEMLLAEIRKEAGFTQEDIARALGVKQPSLSKLESQDDMQISTLQRLIQALGGQLELIAHMPDGDIRIRQFKTQSQN